MHEYTAKERKILSSNPYTYKITNNKLYFTIEFKETFWTGYKAGASPRQLLSDMGYDLDMFRQKQIDSITQRIKKEAESSLGFTEGENTGRRRRGAAADIPDVSAESMKLVWNEVKFLRQEVEFLKKLFKRERTMKVKA